MLLQQQIQASQCRVSNGPLVPRLSHPRLLRKPACCAMQDCLPQGRSKWASEFRHAQAAELNMWGEVDSCGSDTYWASHAPMEADSAQLATPLQDVCLGVACVRGGGKPEMQDRHVMLQDFAAQAAVTVTQVDVSASSHTLLCPPLQYQPSYAPLLRLPNLPQQQYSDLPLHTYSHSPTDSGASSSSSSQGRHVASSETSGSQASIGSPSLRSSPGHQPRSLHTSSSSGGGGPSSSPSVLASAWQAAHSSVPSSLTAVFDGHSGSRAARAAAWRLPTLLACNPQLAAASGQSSPMRQMEPDAVGALDSALHSAFACMEHEILEDARSRPPGESDGTTALVGLQVGLHLAVANAGDCRAVLCRGGRALRLTTDHTPDLPRERQRIEACNGMVYQVRGVWRLVRPIAMGRGAKLCAVSRGLGDLDFKEPVPLISAQPEVTHVTLRPSVDEFVVYGSDGLWAVLEDQEVVAHVADELQQLLGDFRHSGCDVAIQDEVDGDVLASTTDDSRNLPIDTLSHGPHALEQTAGVVPATALHVISRRVAARSREQRSTAASAAAASLVELAKSRGSRDDITAVVTLFDWGCLPVGVPTAHM
ncbi:phosphatase 2C-like domain-containing protein [Haematococcus lacustris]